MFTASAELYDLLYARLKDYGAEADRIAALLRALHPGCRTVLDVACGTGEHVRRLVERGFVVDGLDLDAGLLRIARAKNPASRFLEADFCDFVSERRYDAVLCLFSSIGYARTLERVARALACFRRALAPGGVVVVEPWFEPGAMDPDRSDTLTVEAPPLHVTRTSRVRIADRVSHLHFAYEITGPDGVRHAEEDHELGLFTVAEMIEAFRAAGLAATWDPVGLTGRGLYVGRDAGA